MTTTADNPLRKAAVFVRGLAPDAAATMLSRLSADEARALRAAIADLGDVEPHEQQRVASHVRRAGETMALTPGGSNEGVELHLSHAGAAVTPTLPPPVEKPSFDGAAWLSSLRDADPSAIAGYLSREQPRVIAAVLGYLTPDLSAGVLQSLPSRERSRVVVQLARQGDADPDSLSFIASGLADWIDLRRKESDRRNNRIETIRRILSATPRNERRPLLDGVAETEPDVAAALAAEFDEPKPRPAPPARRPEEPQPLPFDRLEQLDGRAIAEALGELEPRQALLALAAASERLLERLSQGLPKRAAADLRSRVLRVGPTTLAEIDRAQAALSAAAGRVVAARRGGRMRPSVEG